MQQFGCYKHNAIYSIIMQNISHHTLPNNNFYLVLICLPSYFLFIYLPLSLSFLLSLSSSFRTLPTKAMRTAPAQWANKHTGIRRVKAYLKSADPLDLLDLAVIMNRSVVFVTVRHLGRKWRYAKHCPRQDSMKVFIYIMGGGTLSVDHEVGGAPTVCR